MVDKLVGDSQPDKPVKGEILSQISYETLSFELDSIGKYNSKSNT